jgi:prepilin-type N-terminal cleavage/methylation domain-containing protein
MFHFKYGVSKQLNRAVSQGFTLIELLIVLVLIGLSSAFVMPSMWQQLEQTKHRAEIAKLKALHDYCRHYAFFKGVSLTVNVNNNFFTVNNQSDGNVLRQLEFKTLHFEAQTIQFDKHTTLRTNTLSISKNNGKGPVEITL